MKYFIGMLGAAVIAVLVAILLYPSNPRLGGTGLLTQSSCTASTSIEDLGSAASSQILATSSRRAWARISQPFNATNVVALSLNYDKAVSVAGANYFQLPNASTTTNFPYIDFGLNTDFPYTGAVQASTSIGAAKIVITQCNF